ncbi:protein OS-9 isoform X3 [Emydura macquarii macquarii]|uniref:protein OS-9 isoform X3 n=1 Tax=Emydura macquarii macquarii TaxID=1129001 RepID=UPI00352B10C6
MAEARPGRGLPGPGLLLLLALLGAGRPLPGAVGSLNLQELNELKYGIEIAAEPVLAGQSDSEDVVVISSKYKQKYECHLPTAALRIHLDAEEQPQSYSGLGILDLLRPMEAAPCLVKTKDWWTYEFCYGKHIQQYHIEESEIKGDILYLGYYQSAFDWDNETAKASKQHRLKRYHSQTYGNGSKCDLSGQPREAEVRFLCEEGSGDYIARVDEPQSCSYVLTVHTTRICHHPFLRPPSSAMPQAIRCHPALSPAQYVEYVHAQVSDTKRKVEEISEELKTLDSRLWNERDLNPASQDPEGVEPAPPLHGEEEADGNAIPRENPGSGPGEAAGFGDRELRADGQEGDLPDRTKEEEAVVKTADDHPADFQRKIHFKVIRNPGDLVQFIEALKESTKKRKEKGRESEKSQEAPGNEEAPGARSEHPAEEEDDEEELLGKFEEELDDILLPGSEMAQLKEEVKTEMEKEFDNIMDEVEDELETEGLKGEFDRNHASKSLASTLNKLIDKLDSGKAAEKGEEEEGEGDPAGGSANQLAKQAADADSDGRVKVRVTRIKPGSPLRKELRVRQLGSENPQVRNLENMVKDLLEREGLKAQGKIEIKIVKTGDFGDEDDTHWLSDEDTKNLKDIFFNIIQGMEEAHKEQRRQQEMEDNYRFVWGQSQEERQAAGNTDSQEPDF